MELDKLFESLDEKVFTSELKQSLQESFDAAVELKSVELAEVQISEAKETLLAETAEKEKALLEKIDEYLELVVDKLVTEAKDSLDEFIVSEKADLMLEAFDAMLVAGGVDVMKINEAKDEEDVENKLQESIEKYDNLVEENIALSKEVNSLIKMGIIAELKEGLSLIESEKFDKLANLVEFSKDKEYYEKLETIKESVKTGSTKVEDEKDEINESVTKKVYTHLI